MFFEVGSQGENKERILFIGYDTMYPITHGGRIAHYGYYYPLTLGYCVDTLFLPCAPKALPLPSGLKLGSSSAAALSDMALSYLGVSFEDELYKTLNTKLPHRYSTIVSVAPLERSRLRYDCNLIKLSFDLHSEHFVELLNDGLPLLYQRFAKNVEGYFPKFYNHTITCSQLDAANDPTLTFVPYYMKLKTARKPYEAGSRQIILAGSGHWHRFTRAFRALKENVLPGLVGKLYLYGSGIAAEEVSDPKIYYHFDPVSYRDEVCSYSIQPIDYRSGVPSKCLEALSRGIPVITTPETKRRFFEAHRHVYAVNGVEEINQLLDLDLRAQGKTQSEVWEDLEAERGAQAVLEKLRPLIG